MEKVIKKRVNPYYSAVLKRQIVREYESGYFTKEALSLKYGILGSNTVLEWQKKYGTLANQESKPAEMKGKIIKGKNTDVFRVLKKKQPKPVFWKKWKPYGKKCLDWGLENCIIC